MPRVGPTARTLGVRDDDIPVDDEALVYPQTGGMSVNLRPESLPVHRRPKALGGESDDPLWIIDEAALINGLRYHDDPEEEGHGFIEPAWVMRIDEYEDLLALTRVDWRPA